MKNRRGEIATLLTLGLVLVGGLVTLATSFIINRQNNLASNPKAATVNCIYPSDTQSRNLCKADCATGLACARCSNGKYRCAGTTDDSVVSPSTPASASTPVPTQASSGKGCGSGHRFPCDHPDINKASCPKEDLEFSCCVLDKFQCGGGDRYRWYGCTGQPCGNTKINQSNGPGYLVACPKGVGPGNIESCAVALTPTPTSGPARGAINGPCYTPYSNPNNRISGYTCNSPYVCSSQNSSGKCIRSVATQAPTTPTVVPTLVSFGGGSDNASINVPSDEDEGESNLTCEETFCPVGVIGGPYFRRSGTNTYFATEQECKNPGPGQTEAQIKNQVCQTQSNLSTSTQCTNQQCASPNRGIWYSYKCSGIPQTINGVTQCPSYSFYAGKDCKNVRPNLNEDNIQQNYCSSPFGDSTAKRLVTINYTVNQTGAINISTTNPTITLHISNNIGYGLKTFNFEIGTTSFPVSGSTSSNTSASVIKASLTYLNSNNTNVSLPCGTASVIDQTATISCDIK